MPPVIPDPALFKVKVDLEVRWGDMDALGHVNNARFLTYFETGRIAYLSMVRPDKRLTEEGVTQVLARVEVDYLRPVEWPAALQICVRAVRVGTTSLEFEHLAIDKSTGLACALGRAVLVSYDFQKKTKAPILKAVRERVREIDGI